MIWPKHAFLTQASVSGHVFRHQRLHVDERHPADGRDYPERASVPDRVPAVRVQGRLARRNVAQGQH